MEVSKVFEGIYGNSLLLMLLKKIYGLKNTAKEFWRELPRAFSAMGSMRSNSDPCMYFKWTEMGLLVWLLYIDDCEYFGRDY